MSTILKLKEPQYYLQTDSQIRSQKDRMCRASVSAMGVKYVNPEALQGSNADDQFLKTVLKYGDTIYPTPHTKAALEYGVELKNYTNGTLEVILKELKQGFVVGLGILHHGPWTAPRGGGHWILLWGSDDTHAYCHDPYGEMDNVNGSYPQPGQGGKGVKYTWKRLLNRWHPEGPGHGHYCTFRRINSGARPVQPVEVPTFKPLSRATLAHIWQCQPLEVKHQTLDGLNQTLEKFQINTPSRLRHFLSQTAHESGNGLWTEELATGEAYEGRLDLGNTQPGDGKKFKGAGYIQVTGRDNYRRLSLALKDPRIIELGASFVSQHLPWTATGWWWKANEMNELCDTNPTVRAVTLRVNGGTTGLASREAAYRRCVEVI
jgi:putative chitinase